MIGMYDCFFIGLAFGFGLCREVGSILPCVLSYRLVIVAFHLDVVSGAPSHLDS